MAKVLAKEYLVVLIAEYSRTQHLAHAVLGHHVPTNLGSALQIVRCAGRNIPQRQRFGHTTAQHGDQVVQHLLFGIVIFLLRGVPCVAAGTQAPGNNGNFLHRVVALYIVGCHSVTCLVISGQALGLLGIFMALFLRAHLHTGGGVVNFCHSQCFLFAAHSQQSSLVEQVFQVCTGKADGVLSHFFQIHIRAKGLVAGMDFQNVLTALCIRSIHGNLAVKTTGAQQRRIQYIRPVGGSHYDNTAVGAKAVHLYQQLVQGLLPLIITAAGAGTSVTAHSINLINKYNGRCLLLGLLKQVAHTRSTHAHIHLYKVRAGNGQKRCAGLTGHSTSQQSFTGTGRAHQQHASRNTGAQCGKAVRVL